MSTLIAHASPETSGQSWLKLVAIYGVGSLIAVLLTVFLARDVKANQQDQLRELSATKAVVQQHIETDKVDRTATNEKLDRIARQLEASCKVAAILARNKAVVPLCEVGR
jgi:cell division protein FtsB